MPYIGQSPATGEANSFKILDNISSYTLTFDGSGADVVSPANDTITEREHRFVTGQRATYNDGGGTAITGLSDGVYYIIVEDRHSFKLASSANNAAAGTAINLTGLGVGASHTLNVAFDGVNTKFKATHTNGTKAGISQSGQLMLSINGVIQQPHDNTDSPSTGYATDHTSTIIFSAAPVSDDEFFGRLIASSAPTFDISDNVVDNFTGDGSTTTFTLSKSPPNNESVLVTIDGIVQYPDDNAAVRAYTVSENTLDFISAPGDGVEIQVRHIGFAGASTADVSGFYGRTGNAVLKSTDNIVFNNATASGTVQAANVTVTGDLTVNGTTTTLDTDLIGVDKLEVAADNTTVAAAITQTGTGDILNLYDGASQVVTVTDGGNVGIGSESPVEKLVVAGDARITGILTVGTSSLTLDGTNNVVNVGTALTLGHTNGIQFYNQSLHSQGLDVNNINVTGIVTATTFSGAVTGTASDASGSTGDFSIADKIVHTGDTNTAIRFPADDTVTVETAGSERVRVTSAGLVGIGLTNPSVKLQVLGGSGDQLWLDNAGERYTQISLRNNGTQKAALWLDETNNEFDLFAAAGYGIRFLADGTEKLRITSAGAINIGKGDESSSSANLVEVYVGATDEAYGTIRGKYNRTNEFNRSEVRFGVESNAAGSGFLAFATGTNSATERLRITSAGSVGIGTNVPQATLHLLSSGGAATGNEGIRLQTTQATGGNWISFNDTARKGYFGYKETSDDGIYLVNEKNSHIVLGTNGAERLRITSDGKMGVGCTPETDLQVRNGNGGTVKIGGSGSGATGFQISYSNSGTTSTEILTNYRSTNSAASLKIDTGTFIVATGTSGAEKLRIDSSGRLGIQGAPTRALLEVRASGGSNTMLTALWGANEGTTAGTLSDNTDKAVRMGIHHYDTDALPYAFLVGSSSNGVNNLTFGGGTSLMNAATEIKFNTAANQTTASGTERLRITSDGYVNIGASGPSTGAGLVNIKPSSGVDSYLKIRPASDFDGAITGAAIDIRNSSNGASQHLVLRAQEFRFWCDGADKVRINSEGHYTSGNLTISGRANYGTIGGYAQFLSDNHGNTFFGQNLKLGVGASNNGDHTVRIINQHNSIGGAGMLIGGNGSGRQNSINFYAESANQVPTTDVTANAKMTLNTNGQLTTMGEQRIRFHTGSTDNKTSKVTTALGKSGTYTTCTVTITTHSYCSVAYDIAVGGYSNAHAHRVGTYYINNQIYGSYTSINNAGGSVSASGPNYVATQKSQWTFSKTNGFVHPICSVTVASGGDGYINHGDVSIVWS